MTAPPMAKAQAAYEAKCGPFLGKMKCAVWDWGDRFRERDHHLEEIKVRKLAQKLGQLQPFCSCIPTGMHGPTCIVWANLNSTPSSI
jgi:hypothetical protein